MARATDVIIHLRPTTDADDAAEMLKDIAAGLLPAGVVSSVEVVTQNQALFVRDLDLVYEDKEAGCPPF